MLAETIVAFTLTMCDVFAVPPLYVWVEVRGDRILDHLCP